MKVLLAVDGSPLARKACRYLIQRWDRYVGADGSLTLLHVDPTLPGDVVMALGAEGVERYHRGNHREALRAVESALRRAERTFDCKTLTGSPAELVARTASNGRYDLVVMGSHGRGTLRALLLGSVVSKVLAACTVPVLIVR